MKDRKGVWLRAGEASVTESFLGNSIFRGIMEGEKHWGYLSEQGEETCRFISEAGLVLRTN